MLIEKLLCSSRTIMAFEVKVMDDGHSVAQIANKVKSRAQELGETKYPSRATIYRILESEIERRSQK